MKYLCVVIRSNIISIGERNPISMAGLRKRKHLCLLGGDICWRQWTASNMVPVHSGGAENQRGTDRLGTFTVPRGTSQRTSTRLKGAIIWLYLCGLS